MVKSYSDNDAIYSIDMMFAYLKNNKHPITKINVSDYVDTLKYPGWGDPVSNIKYSAFDVIENSDKYPKEYNRILNADLSYPIIISDNNIIDGVHRLSKAYLEKKKKLRHIFLMKNL